jgi:hypothetical protein
MSIKSKLDNLQLNSFHSLRCQSSHPVQMYFAFNTYSGQFQLLKDVERHEK